MWQRGQHEPADHRAEQLVDAAKQDHSDDVERLRDGKILRLNKSRVEAIEAAGQPSKRAADDERQELVSENVNSKRLAELFRAGWPPGNALSMT